MVTYMIIIIIVIAIVAILLTNNTCIQILNDTRSIKYSNHARAPTKGEVLVAIIAAL